MGPLDGTAWVLTGLAGQGTAGNPAATLQFECGRLSGSDGCNRFSGSYSATKSALAVSPQLASTRMACPPEVEAQARAFLAALTGATAYRADGTQLVLLAANGATLATLAAQSKALAGTSWTATGINNGKQAVTSVIAGSRVSLSFGADGVASGSGGCNRYGGPYESQGSSISFGQIAATAMACAQSGLMEQEQAFLKALSTASTLRFEGDRLELRTADGALAVILARTARD
jgi:heat shock protein HslJ